MDTICNRSRLAFFVEKKLIKVIRREPNVVDSGAQSDPLEALSSLTNAGFSRCRAGACERA